MKRTPVAVSFLIIVVLLFAQLGCPKKDANKSAIESFGGDIRVEKDSALLIFSGDFDGDTINDIVAVVNYDPKVPFNEDVKILLPWGKPQLTQPKRPRALAIINRKDKGKDARFLITGDAPQAWEEGWENRGVGIVSKDQAKSAIGNAEIQYKGDLINMFTQAGIDTFLYWDGQTYKVFEPIEEP